MATQNNTASKISVALEKARLELLDQTARNKLINTPKGHSKSIRVDVIDELSDFVYSRLVEESKHMFFAAQEDGEDNDEELLATVPTTTELNSLQQDNILQTKLSEDRLQHNLRRLQYDARTYESEQGVNILYLAMGFLKWYEDSNSDVARYAPLLLIPVSLSRKSINAQFRVQYTGAEIVSNLSIKKRISNDFAIELPTIESFDDFSPKAYFDKLKSAISHKPRWEICDNDITLWFYSFTRFLMYRDLESENWPSENQLANNSLIRSLLVESFGAEAPICGDNDKIDEHVDLLNSVHVMDCDSSQALAIEEVKRGRNLIIQGPPGTGKSQTIVNLIAAAVEQGKTVLFVAEKMAALDVVQRRLSGVGLGAICLELHSNKSRKKLVLEELDKTLRLGEPEAVSVRKEFQQLSSLQNDLNSYATAIHKFIADSSRTPYQVVGELVRLASIGFIKPSVAITDSCSWTKAEFESRKQTISELVAHLNEMGDPVEHPWKGVGLSVIMPSDLEGFVDQIRKLLPLITQLKQHSDELRLLNEQISVDNFSDLSMNLRAIKHCLKAPEMDTSCITDDCWSRNLKDISSLVSTGQNFSKAQSEIENTLNDLAWSEDAIGIYKTIEMYGTSLFRFFRKQYRASIKSFESISRGPLPKDHSERLSILTSLIQAQQSKKALLDSQADQLGIKAFGDGWNKDQSRWDELDSIVNWVIEADERGFGEASRTIYASVCSEPRVEEIQTLTTKFFKQAYDLLSELVTNLCLDVHSSLGSNSIQLVSIRRIETKLNQWLNHQEAIFEWDKYRKFTQTLETLGLIDLATKLNSGSLEWPDILELFECAYYDSLLRHAYIQTPELSTFDSLSHHAKLEKFIQLDKQRIEMAKLEVAQKHYSNIPHAGTVGEVALIKREIEKKSRHLPIRQLISKAGGTLQQIKPVFMMSPLSIAQFLEPGAIEFDLLVIDEASQVKPVDALGAMARCKQFVVVGDSKQLPPTSFFNRRETEVEDDEDEVVESAGVMESILSLCSAQNVNDRMLRWHYRSKHHTLISVSNNEFYDNRLNVIPSPKAPEPGEGLIFHHLPDACYDRGKSATNEKEAKAVAEAVIQHFRDFPDKTLGVGTFSSRQRDKILDEIELLRRENPDLEQHFSSTGDDPFFVKNLENIQGDERDFIFISICYGRDPEGYMAMNFGPLSNEGGERRLNVLITRARQACVVYSSITHKDIDTNRSKAKGTRALKSFLRYAESGILDTVTSPKNQFDSEFEKQVALAIEREGFEVHSQVGTAGFFIDLAVVNKERPGEYLIGIECDGANYHSSRSARDRDRLRQSVLEHHGWTIHRIWSTDWFQRPKECLRKVVEQIQLAEVGRGNSSSRNTSSYAINRKESADDLSEQSIATEEYKQCVLPKPTSKSISETDTYALARRTTMTIRSESPIHEQEVIRRIKDSWQVRTVGSRMKASIKDALVLSTRENDITKIGMFYVSAEVDEKRIRDRTNTEHSNLKKAEFIPPMEVSNAIIRCLQINPRSNADDVSKVVSRSLGIKSRSAPIYELIESQIEELVSSGLIQAANGVLELV